MLLIPSVLALLGDNPMQSEFTSHIGMNGNLFCRVCLVQNTMLVDEAREPMGNLQDAQSGSDAGKQSQDSDSTLDLGDLGCETIADSASSNTVASGKRKARGSGRVPEKRKRGIGPRAAPSVAAR